MSKLNQLLNELEQKLPYWDSHAPVISKSSVAWQIEHSLLVITRVIAAISKSDDKDYKWKFNLMRTIVLTTGHIPRGKAKSPSSVRPEENINKTELRQQIIAAKEKIDQLNTLSPLQHFEHPYFGNLNLKRTIRFLETHTEHHLKIIEDIIKAK